MIVLFGVAVWIVRALGVGFHVGRARSVWSMVTPFGGDTSGVSASHSSYGGPAMTSIMPN